MKIIFLAYREWATRVYQPISRHPKISSAVLCTTTTELLALPLQEFDLLVTLGWSDELGEDVCASIPAIGLHCAELDRYSYGSPLQLQIIDGIVKTKHRIFPFTSAKNSPRAHTHTREYSHEVDLYLHGGIEEIFAQLTTTSMSLLHAYFDDYPNISYSVWPKETIVCKKRIPEDSRISHTDFSTFSTEKLYNIMRSLESPYPNAFIEDEHGILYFERVRFKKK